MKNVVQILQEIRERRKESQRLLIDPDRENFELETPNEERKKGKSLDLKPEFDIVEVPALSVREYVRITLIISLICAILSPLFGVVLSMALMAR